MLSCNLFHDWVSPQSQHDPPLTPSSHSPLSLGSGGDQAPPSLSSPSNHRIYLILTEKESDGGDTAVTEGSSRTSHIVTKMLTSSSTGQLIIIPPPPSIIIILTNNPNIKDIRRILSKVLKLIGMKIRGLHLSRRNLRVS